MARDRRHRTRRPRRRNRGGLLLAALLAAAATIGFATTQAFTAGNAVPATKIGTFTKTIAPVDLEPAECIANGITVTSIVAGSGTVTSTAANQLVLGSSGIDSLSDGGYGSACMVGGASKDSFQGTRRRLDLCVVSSATTSVKWCTTVATRP
jgi:hypothetical protein